MTYAGVMSLLHAKAEKDDERVKKAVAWIRDHYTLEENPGLGTTSLYFYYMVLGKCLDALGEESLTDSRGKDHPWREDLLERLVSTQNGDGFWENADGRFMENIREISTAYAVIAMKFALKPKKIFR
jgi:squalene-hopene/tetraprenyl-beta-curcumene cyclase